MGKRMVFREERRVRKGKQRGCRDRIGVWEKEERELMERRRWRRLKRNKREGGSRYRAKSGREGMNIRKIWD